MTDTNLEEMTKEQLVQLYADACVEEEEIVATKTVLREEILRRLKGDGEVIGDYSVTRAKRYSFTATVEQAREFGAVKEAVDQTALKKLYLKGAKIPGEVKITEYPIIKNILEEKAKVEAETTA